MDTRAVVPAIGFVLLIAIAVSWLGLYQAEIVPVQNLQTEYEHNEDIQNELVELRDLIHRSGTTGISSSMPIELGTQYDSRLFAVNPHRPTGSISTTEPPSNITIRIGDSEADFETKFIEYEPNYREYENAPSTTIEHSLVYNSFPNAEKSVTISDHRLFEGNQLTIPIISGDISEQGANAVSVRITALDRPEEGEGDIQFTPGDTVNVTLPTEQPELWQDELEDNVDAEDIKQGENTVSFETTVDELHLYFVDVDAIPVGDIQDSGVDGDGGDEEDQIREENIDDDPSELEDSYRCEGICTPTEHDEVNEESFADERLFIPEGEDFVPESDANFTQDDDVNYTFRSYDIYGNITTRENIAMTSTDGDIVIGGSGSVFSGRSFNFNANGNINIDGATLSTDEARPGQGDMTLSATGNISAVGAELEAGDEINIIAEGQFIDLTDARLAGRETGEGGRANIDITVTADTIVINDTDFIEGNGDVELNGETVDSRP